MKKVLITGGAGFIGTHLAERLSQSAEVTLLDSFRRDSLSLAPHLKANPGVTVVPGDIKDADTIGGAFAGVDTVIHLAAIAGVSSYYAEPLITLQTNILGTVNVLEAAVQSGAGRFVYFSTSEVFGPDALWVKETDSFNIGSVMDARWVYAASKVAGENFAFRYAEKHGFECTVVRPFNVYGPRQVGEGAISNFCRAVVDGEPMKVYGDGSALRAWCFVSDVVDAVMAVLSSTSSSPRVYNIGNPRELVTTLALARRLAELNPGARLIVVPEGHSEVRSRAPVIDKARTELGFEPKVSLDDGLKLTLDWFARQKKCQSEGERQRV